MKLGIAAPITLFLVLVLFGCGPAVADADHQAGGMWFGATTTPTCFVDEYGYDSCATDDKQLPFSKSQDDGDPYLDDPGNGPHGEGN